MNYSARGRTTTAPTCLFALSAFSFFLLVANCLGQFATQNVTFLSQVPLNQMGGGEGADVWGWEDPLTGKEYALMGRTNGTAFVDVTDGANPVYLGNLPSHTSTSVWRDIKVYDNHAYVVSDNNGPHGVQIFDLTQLRNVTSPQTFSNTAHYNANDLRSAHNIAINEDSGFAYVVGSNLSAGGLHILDLANPISPTFAGSFDADGYTHDAQIVNYTGPDPDYAGREIAFAANTDTVTIVDVTNKSNTTQISRNTYPNNGYTHQGWLTENQKYFLFGDELDEFYFGFDTRTHVFDVTDLDNPAYVGYHQHTGSSIDHNLYVKGDYVFEANYTRGLRILEMTDLANAQLTEVGFIDTYGASNSTSFNGAWSVYPYFNNGKVIISDIQGGLVVAEVDLLVNNLDGDFDGNGLLNCVDIDALTVAIVSGANDSDFDLTGDGLVDLADQSQWLADAGAVNLPSGNPYLVGDATLDGNVDSSDYNAWNAAKFTDTAAWCAGDFNASGAVDASDFNMWNSHKFTTSADTAAVPEPGSLTLLLLGVVGWLTCRNRVR